MTRPATHEPGAAHASRRRLTVALGWAARLVSVVASLVTVRVAFGLLGEGEYAIYQLLTSALAWLTLCSFGLGPALKNLIAEHRAHGEADLVLRAVSALLVAVMFVTGLAGLLAGGTAASTLLFRRLAHDPVWAGRAAVAGGVCTLLTVLGQVSFEILYAELRARWVYLLTMAGAGVGVVLLTQVPRLGRPPAELLFWAVSASLGPPAACGVVALWATGLLRWRIRAWQPAVARRVGQLAARFWVFAALSNLVLLVDALVISQILQAGEIVLYSVMMRVVTVGLAFTTTIVSVVWPEWTRLWALDDRPALRASVRRLAVVGVLACVPGALVGMRLLPAVLQVWLPQAHILPSGGLVLAFAVYFAVRFWTDVHSAALMAGNRIGAATRFALVQAVITAPLELALGQRYGAAGVIGGLLLGFGTTAAWLFPRRFYAETREVLRRPGSPASVPLGVPAG